MPLGQTFRTPEAIADLDKIWDYIACDSLAAADRMIEELNERFELLARSPEIGELQSLLAHGTCR